MSDKNLGKTIVNTIVSAMLGSFISTVKSEIEIAKIELSIKGKKIGAGVAMLAAAAVLAFFMLMVFLAAAVAGIAEALPVWLSALIVAGAILLIVLILALVGASKIKKNAKYSPERAINNIKNSMPF
jgi:cytochrome c biogenesis protein CcdA